MAKNFDDAKNMLVHYFRLVLKQAGGTWDDDHGREVHAIVDSLEDGIDWKIETLRRELMTEIRRVQ